MFIVFVNARVIHAFTLFARDSRISESLFGYGVIAASAKRIAAEYAVDRKDQSDKKATFSECFQSVLGAGWRKSAASRL